MIVYKQADSDIELRQILLLQQTNLPKNLTEQEKTKQGFLTVEHSFEILKEMNEMCKHTLAIAENRVVGYALSMHPSFGDTIPVLTPMFTEINKIISRNTEFSPVNFQKLSQ